MTTELRAGDVIRTIHVGDYTADEDTLLSVAMFALTTYVDRRAKHPTLPLPAFLNVLLTNGRLLAAQVGDHDEHDVAKALALNLPVFGFFVIGDGLVDSLVLDAFGQPFSQRDALIMHVGTRAMRRMFTRPYTITAEGAVFDNPPPADVDKREAQGIEDSWADVFTAPSTETSQ